MKIIVYRAPNGREPLVDWLESLDREVRAKINARITRLRETGNLGIYEPVGQGVYELKFYFGPGYRIYFGLEKNTPLILLFGGSKKLQQRDINKAKEFWREFLSRGEDEKNEKL